MHVVVLFFVSVIAVFCLWAFVVMGCHILGSLPRLLKRFRFGIFDLLFLTALIAISLAFMRAAWDTPMFGFAMLVPIVAPLAWMVRFALDDRRGRLERRSQLRAAKMPDMKELTDRPADSPPPRARSKWWQRGNQQSGVPHLSPYSLSQRPLDRKGD